jgi:hypothetical protein
MPLRIAVRAGVDVAIIDVPAFLAGFRIAAAGAPKSAPIQIAFDSLALARSMIADDLAFLAAHPVRQSNRGAGRG